MNELLNQYPAVLTITEVVEILNVTPATVRRHIKENDIPHIDEIFRFLFSQLHNPFSKKCQEIFIDKKHLRY